MARCQTSLKRRRGDRERRERRRNDTNKHKRSTRRSRPRRAATRQPIHLGSDSDETELDEDNFDREEALRTWRLTQSNPYGFINRNQALEDEEDRFYVIQELLDKRYDREGNEEYLVRWQNYPPEYDSWEPRAELEKNSLDMIHEFNRMANGDRKDNELHCVCRRPYRFDQGGMILCDNCKGWYHFSCLQMNMVEANSYAKFHCQSCRNQNPNLKNVIKREKVNLLYGNTRLVDIENTRMPPGDEPFTV